MSKSLLVTRPNYEITTRYLYIWNKKVIKEALKRGINVLDLKKEKATKKEFTGRMTKVNPTLILLNGHGNNGCVTGHNGDAIVQAGYNEGILEGKKVAGLFLDPSNRLSISLIKGNNVSNASKKSKKFFAENIKKLLNSDNDSQNNSSSFIPFLLWNMKHQTCHGNQNACF